MSTERIAAYKQEVAAANKAVWDGINTLVGLQREWNALDYGSSGSPEIADYGAVTFATANALVDVLNTGHATNMSKLL